MMVANEHWFDGLHRRLTTDEPRRGLLSAAGALALGLLLGTASVDEAVGKKKRRRKKGSGKGGKGKGRGNGGKGKPKPKPLPAEEDTCATTWPGDHQQEDRYWCRRTRDENCPQANLEFCIVEGDLRDPAKVAACCNQDQSCCVDIEGRGECVHVLSNDHNCGTCGNACQRGDYCNGGECISRCGPGGIYCPGAPIGCCQAGFECSGAETCVPISDPVCSEGFGNCYPTGDPCANLSSDDNHCGRCHNRCSLSRHCIGGTCVSLAEEYTHECPSPTPGAQPIRVPASFPCCPNNVGYCRETYRCAGDTCAR